ncbi:MAG: HEAT repeat domain-containing protein [Deltaproteobacteria bacterium]|nr:MAG: HEAT repeat domain-containing protein [Deltaproteobacteria bacterium]
MASRALSLGGANLVPTLTKSLQHKSALVRLGAARALGLVGKPAAPAIPRLLACLNDPKSAVRSASATALGKIGVDEKRVVPALSRLLEDKKLLVVSAATTALALFKIRAVLAIPALLRQYSKDNCLHCTMVSVTLGKMGSVVVPPVLRQLQLAKKRNERVGLLRALGEMGKEAGEAVPAVTALLRHKHKDIRVAAAGALWDIEVGNTKTVAVLRKTLRDPSLQVRAFSARALSSMGRYAKAALPELRLSLRDSHSWVIREAILAIGKIGKDATSALPDLFPLLHRAPSVCVRTNAAQAIGRIGCALLATKSALLKALRDSNSWVRHWTVDALVECKASGVQVVKHLKPLLRDTDSSVVRSAKKALRLLLKSTTLPSSSH